MGLGDIKDMMGQMRAAQQQMKEVQKKLSSMRISAESGGGTVKATVDGEANLLDLEIDTALLDIDELKVKTIYVEQGATLKRFSARAKGRGNRISKPTCHIFVSVGN